VKKEKRTKVIKFLVFWLKFFSLPVQKFNFMIFVATKKGKKNFSPFSFVAVVGSGIRDPG
jgi:hypothetical protein